MASTRTDTIERSTVNGVELNVEPDNEPIIKTKTKWKRITKFERVITILAILGIIACIIVWVTSKDISTYRSPSIREALLNKSNTVSDTADCILSESTKIVNFNETEFARENRTTQICYTPECIHTASAIIKSMDLNENPCDDFYKFSCGNFDKNHVINEDQTQVNEFSLVDDELKKQLKLLISDEPKPNEPKPFKLANYLYEACMNKSLIEEIGLKEVNNISDILGGWPVINNNWTDVNWSWSETNLKLKELGTSSDFMFSFTVDIDLKNNSKRTVQLDQADIGINREYLINGLDDQIVKAYYKLMVDTAINYGANKIDAENQLKEALEFEIELANASWSTEQRRNTTALYNPMTINDLSEKYPYLDWLNYINSMLPDGIKVTQDEITTVGVPTYFQRLGELLKITPKRTISNYILWRFHHALAPYLTKQVRKAELKFAEVIYGQKSEQDRWKECIDITQKKLEISVSALYVHKYFLETSKSAALEMVNEIRMVFKNILENVSWMDEETRKSALHKIDKVVTHIGYPNELADNQYLIKYYEKLDIDPNNYLQSILNIKKFKQNNTFSKLRKPVNNTDWETHSEVAVVNAFYNAVENSIQFPAGILQGKFFSAGRPKYMNYGAIGYVIGHEITHGFDDLGRQFDSNGNLVDWWQEQTKNAYLVRAKCVSEQYSNYTDVKTGLMLNGGNTLGEAIADTGGAKEAYLAYNNWVKKNGKEPILPGLNYTQNQMFWIAAGQNWCSLYSLETRQSQITTGVHPPAEYRVIGTVSNQKEFASDFNCPMGSPMNPANKCGIW